MPPKISRDWRGHGENKGEHKDRMSKPASITVKVVDDFPDEVSVDSCRSQTAKYHVAFELLRAPEKAQITGGTWACRAKRSASPDPPMGYRSHSLVSGSRERAQECC